MTLMPNAKGFALPTVLIASIVMMIVLLASLTSTSSISAGIRSQYSNKLAKEAVESGFAMAQACISMNGSPTWSTASPLRPGTDCNGGTQCNTGPSCYVVSNGMIKTTFTVNTATQNSDGTYTIPSVGNVQFLRGSNASVNTNLSASDTRRTKSHMGWKVLGMGTSHSCGITINDRTYCWGYGATSGIGNGKTNPASVTVPYPIAQGDIPLGVYLVSVVSNDSWSSHCGLGSNNKVYCWGSNAYGQLGNNTTVDSNVPVQVAQGAVPAGVTFTSIQIGFYHACALASNGNVYCWGRNQFGQLGDNTTTTSTVPVLSGALAGLPAGISIKSLSVGFYTSCVIGSNDKGYCWGYNATGQFGNGTTTNSPTPVAISQGAVPNGVNWKFLSVGTYHSCGIGTNDKAYCWGDSGFTGGYNALGNGGTVDVTTPVAVSQGATPAGATWISVDVGDNAVCGIANNNKAYCWGLNPSGQLGNNTTTASNVPVAVSQGEMPAAVVLKTISLGDDTPCALDTLNITYCWGNGGYGKLGNGVAATSSGPDALTPVRMRIPAESGLSF